MSNYLTEEDAGRTLCNRTIGFEFPKPCLSSVCSAWRWQPLMVTAEWIAQVRKRGEETKEQAPGRPRAAQWVNEHRAELGLPDAPFRGYCGLAGKPEV